MRWRTYNKHVERFDAYEAILCRGVAELLAKFLAEFDGERQAISRIASPEPTSLF
jgi:hypothetical protein